MMLPKYRYPGDIDDLGLMGMSLSKGSLWYLVSSRLCFGFQVLSLFGIQPNGLGWKARPGPGV